METYIGLKQIGVIPYGSKLNPILTCRTKKFFINSTCTIPYLEKIYTFSFYALTNVLYSVTYLCTLGFVINYIKIHYFTFLYYN